MGMMMRMNRRDRRQDRRDPGPNDKGRAPVKVAAAAAVAGPGAAVLVHHRNK